jgi:DNA-binding response OmpR family regulator
VDQDDSVLEAVGTILRGRDHRVLTARDIRDARVLLEKHDFDLVVADLEVADGAGGDGLTEWLIQHKPALAQRVIWMCAMAQNRSEVEKSTANKRHVLQKPFKANELLAAVDELLLSSVAAAPMER